MNMVSNVDAISNLAVQYEAVERYDEAIFFSLLTNYLQTDRIDAIYRAANLLLKTGRRWQAVELLAGQVQHRPDNQALRQALTKISGWSDTQIESNLEKMRRPQIDEFFLVRRCGETDAPLAVWFCGFTDKSEANLTISFVKNTGRDMLIACLPKLHSLLNLDVNKIVYCTCFDIRPETVILFSCGLTGINCNVAPAILGFAKEKLNFKLAAIWIDMAKPLSTPLLRSYAPFVDAMAACDATIDNVVATTYPGKSINLWHVVDEAALSDQGEPRDIDVSFVGQISGNYENRRPFIERLKKMGIEHFLAGRDHGRYISHEKYAEVMRRSKIILNFSQFSISSIWDWHPLTREHFSGRRYDDHVKGRVYEILHAGAVLLESANDEITKVLAPGQTYVPFTTPDDMEAQIRDLLENEKKRTSIGEAGRLLAESEFTSRGFWKKIMDTIEQNR